MTLGLVAGGSLKSPAPAWNRLTGWLMDHIVFLKKKKLQTVFLCEQNPTIFCLQINK